MEWTEAQTASFSVKTTGGSVLEAIVLTGETKMAMKLQAVDKTYFCQ